jgi:hypothetical protein
MEVLLWFEHPPPWGGLHGRFGWQSIAAYIAYGRINPIAANRRAIGMSRLHIAKSRTS